MTNVYGHSSNRRIYCGRRTCNSEVGRLQRDNVNVILKDYRLGRLMHISTVSEYTAGQFTNIVLNRIVEEGGYLNHYEATRPLSDFAVANLLGLQNPKKSTGNNVTIEHENEPVPSTSGRAAVSNMDLFDRLVQDLISDDNDPFLNSIALSDNDLLEHGIDTVQ